MSETECVACQRIAEGICPGCGHVHGDSVCTERWQDKWGWPEEAIPCGCESSRDHYLMHPHRICLEDMTEYSYYDGPDYWNCINAKVHGYDKCWVHLTLDQKREFSVNKRFASRVEMTLV